VCGRPAGWRVLADRARPGPAGLAFLDIHIYDFREISISPVISKIFEKCILDRFAVFFETHDSQFGF